MPGLIDRRYIVGGMAAATGLLLAAPISMSFARRKVRKLDISLPAIGMGSWRTFDVRGDSAAIAERVQILRDFFAAGGQMIDSSPMYGSSQSVIGHALKKSGTPQGLFSTDKVWTSGKQSGIRQIAQSQNRWNISKFDLLQIHNLVDWKTQLATLLAMKAEGRLRYVGITSYEGINYDGLEHIMRTEPIDFVQFTYNIADQRAENRLLPLALDLGIGVIINRPFREGQLTQRMRGKELPGNAKELECTSWAQYMLKYAISHPSVTCAIPATSCAKHMRENMRAQAGPMPDQQMRKEMERAFSASL